MVDHGLMVAGIVHSIAPAANVRVIEALNCYGVGSLATLGDAVNQLLQTWPASGAVVVNCSLTIVVPEQTYSAHRSQVREMGLWARLEDTLNEHPGIIDTTHLAVAKLFQQVYARGGVIVAAAGNEGANNVHPPARLPAADPNVLGVGALDVNLGMTDYSNRGDTPTSMGVLTFGGSDQPNGFAAIPSSNSDRRGVLGVYTQDFPDATDPTHLLPNQNGWAYWAGHHLLHRLSAARWHGYSANLP